MKNTEILLVATIAIGTLLNPLNSAMIAVALPRLQQCFAMSFIDISWLISSYYLVSAIGQPVMGKISDILGRRQLFLIGLVLVGTASMLAPLAPNLGWLMSFRIIQAVGSSTLSPAGMGIIRDEIKTQLPQALGLMSIFTMTSAAFGPSVGGLLLSFGDWSAIFLVNFPFVAVSGALALRVLHKEPQRFARLTKIDIGGICLFVILGVSWMGFLLSFNTGIDWGLLPIGLVSSVTFYHWERRCSQPFIDMQTLSRNVGANLVYLQFILVNIVFYSLFFGMPIYLQTNQHFSVATTGTVMLSLAGFGVLATPIATRLISRKGFNSALYIGALCMTVGALLLLTIGTSADPVWTFIVLAILGFTSTFNNLGLQTALYSYVSHAETGAATGLFMTSRYIGTMLSSSLLGLLFTRSVTGEALTGIAISGTVIGIGLVVLTMRLPKEKKLSNL